MDSSSSLFGVKVAVVLAGFVGGVMSLSFIKELSRWQAVSTVFAGVGTATYLTPIIVEHYQIGSPHTENGIAFLVGLTAMNIIPGVIRLSDKFKNNPSQFIGGPK